MKIKIVCWGTEKDIFSDDLKGGLFEVNPSGLKRTYHSVDGNIVEIVSLEKNEELIYKECRSNNKNQITVLFVNGKSISIIDKIQGINNRIMILDKYDSIDEIYENDHNNIKYIHFVKEKYDISSIVYFILDDYTNKHGINCLAGCECSNDLCGNMVMNILKNLNYIKNYNNLQLNLHVQDTLGLDKIAYIEDILKEYINEGSVLIIKQSVVKNMDNKIYFNLLGVK